jgi:hypothetical protein
VPQKELNGRVHVTRLQGEPFRWPAQVVFQLYVCQPKFRRKARKQ